MKADATRDRCGQVDMKYRVIMKEVDYGSEA